MDARHVAADVLIAGGGPAGAAAAIACAQRGMRVVLCERERFPRERPGETLHPGVEPILTQLGITTEQLQGVTGARHAGTWVEWGGERRFEKFGRDEQGDWLGFQVWRADFDALLLERARSLGVLVLQPCTVVDRQDDGVVTSEGEVRARVLMDATGRSRWLARVLGVDSVPHSPRLFARYGYVTGSCPARDAAPALVADAAGWTWTARVRSGLYQWTRVTFDGVQADAAWLPAEFTGMPAVAPTRGADVTWRVAEQVADDGWFMIGDAAAILDPASSHGVLKALMSGMMAAHLASAVLQQQAPPEEAARAYRQWLGDWFAADVAALRHFYRDLEVEEFRSFG